MLIALVEQLNFEKQMLIDGNCKQQITIAVPCTGANAYTLVTYFMINLLRCGPDYVFDGANLFLCFQITNNNGANNWLIDHSCGCLFQKTGSIASWKRIAKY